MIQIYLQTKFFVCLFVCFVFFFWGGGNTYNWTLYVHSKICLNTTLLWNIYIMNLPRGWTFSSEQRAVYWDITDDGARLLITVGILITSPDSSFMFFSPNGWSFTISLDVIKSMKWSTWSLEYFSRVSFSHETGSPTPWRLIWFFACLYLYLDNSGSNWNMKNKLIKKQ